MRRLVILMCAGLMMTTTVPVFAESATTTTAADQKNECLLASKNCLNQVDSIQQKIKKLNKEISKGTKVYTPEELKRLKAKLDETNMLLDDLLQP